MTAKLMSAVLRGQPQSFAPYLQLKATESVGYIREAFAAHSNIDVVTTREVFARIANLDKSELHQHVVDGHFLNGHLEGHVQAGIDGVGMTPEFELPLMVFGIIAVQSLKGYLEGKTSSKEAKRSGANRAWRTLVCRAAAYVSIFVSHEPLVGLPTSVLTRLAFGRHDVQKSGLEILKDLTTAQRAKCMPLHLQDNDYVRRNVFLDSCASIRPLFATTPL